jgi:pantetheine-phosphate adenylyltransferase
MLLDAPDLARAAISLTVVALALAVSSTAHLLLPAAVLLVGLFTWLIFYPLCFPSVQSFPYGCCHPMRGCCVLAGSFNPPHEGHLAMIKHLAATHRRVHVAIGFNASKRYSVSPAERVALLREMLAALPNVEVATSHGYIWRHAVRVGATTLFRGIRTWQKDGPEERVLHLLNLLGPPFLGARLPIPTVFLEGDRRFTHLSSTLIRERCAAPHVFHSALRDADGGCPNDVVRRSAEELLSGMIPESSAGRVLELYRTS